MRQHLWRAQSSSSGLYTGREAYEDRDTSKVGKSWDKLSLWVKLEISLIFLFYLFLRKGILTHPTIDLNSWSSCLTLLNARIRELHHHIQFKTNFLMELLIYFLMVEQNTVKQMRGDDMDVLLPADYKGLKNKW